MGEHPTDRQLAAHVDATLDAAEATGVAAHVDQCPRCRALVAGAGPRLDAPPLTQFAGAMLELGEDERPDVPARGEIWRLSWDDDDALCIVWTSADDHLRVLPVIEPYSADEWCLRIDEDENTLRSEFAVSVALAATVPWAVLDARIGTLDDVAPLEQLAVAFRRGEVTDLPTGDRVLHATDGRLTALDETAEQFERFAEIDWPPAEVPAVALPSREVLLEALEPLGDDRYARALNLLRDGVPTTQEADLIEARTGIRLAAPPVAPDVVRVLSSPAFKSQIREWAANHNRSESESRHDLAEQMAEPLAARGTYGHLPAEVRLARILDVDR